MSSKFPPVKQIDLRKFFQYNGWEGPYSGGSHMYMVKGERKYPIPSDKEISGEYALKILKQAGYTRDDWTGWKSG